MATILSAFDLLKGKTGKWDKYSTLVSPVQMLPRKEKDDDWKEANLDWYERIGIMQVSQKATHIFKWYNMAEGVIDKRDYIIDPNNEHMDLIEAISRDADEPVNLHFYPIIPNVINLMVGEFTRRSDRTIVKAIDDYSINEMLEKKKELMTQTVVSDAQNKLLMKMAEQGIEPDEEQVQQAMQSVMSLPEIQAFMNKSYRGVAETWATNELDIVEERFRMYELEALGFRDSLISGEEFWHVRLTDDDYEVEIWNPINTFYHKSPEVRYVSEGNYAGRITMMSIPDVIDRFGYLMTKDQIKSLEKVITPRADFGRLMGTGSTSTDFWDNTKKPEDQIKSIHWNQAVAMRFAFNDSMGFFDWMGRNNDLFNQGMVRVVEVYWKSQKQVGHLKKINDKGEVFEDVVSEDYVITEQPVYDTSINKKKTKDNLIYGEHIDWVWINEVWKGTKIGLNYFNGWMDNNSPFKPIYLDVRPLEFQFKGDFSLYGCKLPVEGHMVSDRNATKASFVAQMAPFQIGFNYVNNQVMDFINDEVGNVILFDQNMIPKNSVDGSWGKHNFVKAYQIMKNYGFLPIDSSLANTEQNINWNQTQQISLDKTNMIASRIKLAEYFKNEAFAVVGVTPQRLGQVGQSESATGVQAAQANSYAQTDYIFAKHTNHLMPRVKSLILNAAQYVNANKKSVRQVFMNSAEENVFFEIEGTKLLLSDFNIYCTSRSDQRALLDQLKQLAINNNTSTASMFDLAKIIESDSVADIISTLKLSEEKAQQMQQQQMEQAQQIEQQKIQAADAVIDKEQAFEAEQNDLDRANDRYLAEIKALGYAKDQDLNQNAIPDPLEVAKFNAELGKHTEDILFKRQQETNKYLKTQADNISKAKELAFKRQQLKEDTKQKEADRKVTRENMKNDLEVAKVNARNRAKKK